MREQDRHFLWSLYSAVAVIFLWKGLWDGIYEIPFLSIYLSEKAVPFVFLFIGFTILTFSGIIFSEFDPLGGVEKAVKKKMRFVQTHPRKHEFTIVYHDKKKDKDFSINGKLLEEVEKTTLILKEGVGKAEIFIPFHRIKKILHKGETYWKQ